MYAHSVMHHFKYFEVFLKLLRQRLKPGGRVAVSDIALLQPLPEGVRAGMLATARAVAGATAMWVEQFAGDAGDPAATRRGAG